LNNSTNLPVTNLNEASQVGADSNLHWYKMGILNEKRCKKVEQNNLLHFFILALRSAYDLFSQVMKGGLTFGSTFSKGGLTCSLFCQIT